MEEESELERLALAEASLIVCTSELTATRVFALDGIDSAKVTVAVPGVDPSPPSPKHREGRWRFLSVGAVVPRKRYEFLIHVLAGLPDRNWHCTIAGNVSRYPAYVAELNETIRGYGLEQNTVLIGEVDEQALERLWEAAHVFLFSSGYEGYGMAIAEALRRGLPIVTTPAGAVADWASDGVVIVRSEDPAEMAIRIAEIRNNRSAYLAARNRALSFGKPFRLGMNRCVPPSNGLNYWRASRPLSSLCDTVFPDTHRQAGDEKQRGQQCADPNSGVSRISTAKAGNCHFPCAADVRSCTNHTDSR
jgi:glycosyltransferase involved in cell wall biosynthesis